MCIKCDHIGVYDYSVFEYVFIPGWWLCFGSSLIGHKSYLIDWLRSVIQEQKMNRTKNEQKKMLHNIRNAIMDEKHRLYERAL